MPEMDSNVTTACCDNVTTKGMFINMSDHVFTDISSEQVRKYTFPNGNTLTIDRPLYLSVSPSGGHRVFDANGKSYYVNIAQSWYIEWVAQIGRPHFVK
jgi:hypothetical protein